MTIQAVAPAKVNLFLHIIGKLANNYHKLESMFVFAQFGDSLSFTAADELTIETPTAELANNDNLIYKAALALQRVTATNYGANITLVKNLPIAAGLGGGSSDAAVTLVSLNKLWDLQLTHTELAAIALTLGADVPSCLAAQACWVEGIGEQITPLELPPLYLVIATPPCPISTIWSYQQIRPPYTPTLGGCALHLQTRDDLVEFLKQQHNDLQNAPLSLVQPTLAALEATGPLLSRMSGSGPSCFGIYGDIEGAEAAARQIKQTNPSWWVVATTTRG